MFELRLFGSSNLKALSDFLHFKELFFFSGVDGEWCLSNVELILLME